MSPLTRTKWKEKTYFWSIRCPLLKNKKGYVHVYDDSVICVCVWWGWGSLIETGQNIRFRSKIVKLLKNKNHSFHMTSPPCENVSLSGFKKRTKCFHNQLARCLSDKLYKHGRTELDSFSIYTAFEISNITFLTLPQFKRIVFIYNETAG